VVPAVVVPSGRYILMNGTSAVLKCKVEVFHDDTGRNAGKLENQNWEKTETILTMLFYTMQLL
jgi:hypothetical protein